MLLNSYKKNGIVCALLLTICCVSGLYEDQIKKFDWRTLHIGALEYTHLNLNNFVPRLLVTTHENVIASLDPKTGDLLWRQVLENEPRGDIKLFHVSGFSEDNTIANIGNGQQGFDALTVQGHAPALVRGWNSNTGTIEFEWSLTALQHERAQSAFWFHNNGLLYHVIPVWDSHIEITSYFPSTGNVVGTTSKITSTWIKENDCVLSGHYYVCLDGKKLTSLDLTATHPQVMTKIIESQQNSPLEPVQGLNGIVIVNNELTSISSEKRVCSELKGNSFVAGVFNQRKIIARSFLTNDALRIDAVYIDDDCKPVPELKQHLVLPEHFGVPKLSAFDCKSKKNSDGKNCLFLLHTNADNIIAIHQQKIRWSREEALANVIAAEFIDLPLTDSEGTLGNEIKGKSGDIVGAFVRRLTTQVHQVKNIFFHLIGLGPPPTDTQKAGIVRDAFGLHKMLVLLTKCGKIYGIDNISGKHHWHSYLHHVSNFENSEPMRLIVQRNSKHFPLEPLCTILAKNTQLEHGILYRFNPITGHAAEGGLLQLNYQIKQLSLLGETPNDFIKGILLLDADNKVHVYPTHAKSLAHGLRLYTADKSTSDIYGYYINYNKNTLDLDVIPIWNICLASHNGDHKIIAIAPKNPIERVHSQGRVLGDRSVLYKYINPNLVAVITQADDSVHKTVLNLHLIDVVSGAMVFSMTHRKVRGPVNIVHSENWLAYSYYNDKLRRTEITTMELYEGKIQTNSTVWSSLDAPPMPLIERQSYIIPTVIEAMRETITERGITNKHVLIGTANGAIIEMPWFLLDPRRPLTSTTQGREEGAIPYIPELPLPTENIINYNQTIARIKNIYTAPSGLESTCLVVATGLDIFVTRVAPSKTFDILKEDFDYILISIVLVVLTSGSLVAKHLASRKLLKQSWK